MPLWFIEGMAEYLSIGPRSPQTAMWLRDAAIEDKLPRLQDLDNPRFFPYRFGHAFWAYVAGRWGDALIGKIMQAVAAPSATAAEAEARAAETGGPVQIAHNAVELIELATGQKRDDFSAAWHAAIRETYAVASGADSQGAGHRHCHRRADWKRIDECRAGPQSRRHEGRVSFGEGSAVDRSVPGRREDRQGDPQAARYLDRPALREPAVPGVGRRVGSRRVNCWRLAPFAGQASARDHRHQSREASSRRSSSRPTARSSIPRGRPTGTSSRSPGRPAARPISSCTTCAPGRRGGSPATCTRICSRPGRLTEPDWRSSPIATSPISTRSRSAATGWRRLRSRTPRSRQSTRACPATRSTRSGLATAPRSSSWRMPEAFRTPGASISARSKRPGSPTR